MIIRNRSINPKSTEVQLAISYGKPDVKAFLAEFLQILTTGDKMLASNVATWRFDEAGVRYFAEHRESIFANMESPWREQLSAWWWYQLLAGGFFVPSACEEGQYLLTQRAFALVKLKSYKGDEE